ncbi:YdcF family protein [Nocardiopsis sp. MG754419]|uniref:YdcF family protein n=1 Tax=Nocardiopsis sp. MG754419 TaxID=2259865 RepID=UPI001BA827AB|nr:YdcF family protein [Nocardiopsis sp. MG754419]MBR8743218.1 YdcF family protein [Nocardiopsis sp. MG754419]
MAESTTVELTERTRRWARVVFDHQRLGEEPRRCDVAVVLGSHDAGVADRAAELYLAGYFPRMVITGANSPTTLARFPRGEAVHYRERVLERGVPDAAVLMETEATNTGENLRLSRAVLERAGIAPATVMFVCKPYMERRAHATARRQWPEVEPLCASAPVDLDTYLPTVGNDRLALDAMVGDLQRVMEYPARGFAVPQPVPPHVREAYHGLVAAGFDGHLLSEG